MAITGKRWLARGRWLMLLAVLLSGLAPDHVFGQDSHHAAADTADAHSQHCHGDAASCTEAPLTTAANVAHLSESLGAAGGPMVRGAPAVSPVLPSGAAGKVFDPPPRDL
ncbi:MAG: hypothetical protein AB7T37_00885 [Dehalococcoidia bacterium]